MVNKNALEGVKKGVQKLIDDIIIQIKDGRIEAETSITDRFVQKIQDFQYSHEFIGPWWRATKFQLVVQVRTLGDRGKNSSESKYGADICLIMDINEEGTLKTKGALIQCKKNENPIKIEHNQNTYVKINVNTQKFEFMNDQIEKMSLITPENYLLIYDNSGFFVINSDQIMNPDEKKKTIRVKAERFEDFFTLLIKCFRGDKELINWTDDFFDEIIRRQFAYNIIHVKVSQNRDSRQHLRRGY